MINQSIRHGYKDIAVTRNVVKEENGLYSCCGDYYKRLNVNPNNKKDIQCPVSLLKDDLNKKLWKTPEQVLQAFDSKCKKEIDEKFASRELRPENKSYF